MGKSLSSYAWESIFECRFAIPAAIGRRFSLMAYALVFCVGAILTTVAGPGEKGLNEIYIGMSPQFLLCTGSY